MTPERWARRRAAAPAAGPPASADDLAALLLALRLGHHDHALALARVLSGAAAASTGARTLALALVDAGALDLVALLLLGARLHGTAGEEGRRGARDQD